MKIGNIADWDVYRSVGSKFGRVDNGGVENSFDDEVGSGDGEEFW